MFDASISGPVFISSILKPVVFIFRLMSVNDHIDEILSYCEILCYFAANCTLHTVVS